MFGRAFGHLGGHSCGWLFGWAYVQAGGRAVGQLVGCSGRRLFWREAFLHAGIRAGGLSVDRVGRWAFCQAFEQAGGWAGIRAGLHAFRRLGWQVGPEICKFANFYKRFVSHVIIIA